jgi:hypothetical protein
MLRLKSFAYQLKVTRAERRMKKLRISRKGMHTSLTLLAAVARSLLANSIELAVCTGIRKHFRAMITELDGIERAAVEGR